tara:strand:+ start:480 stop:1142 length:663 start_codon:yes stop_codon:yes gene_type:complete
MNGLSMKGLNMKSLTTNKNVKLLTHNKFVLYILLAITLINLITYLGQNNLCAIILFLTIGLITTKYSKNMVLVLLSSIVLTNILVKMGFLGMLGLKEGYGDASGNALNDASENDMDDTTLNDTDMDDTALNDTDLSGNDYTDEPANDGEGFVSGIDTNLTKDTRAGVANQKLSQLSGSPIVNNLSNKVSKGQDEINKMIPHLNTMMNKAENMLKQLQNKM